jgi:hypothetical protein
MELAPPRSASSVARVTFAAACALAGSMLVAGLAQMLLPAAWAALRRLRPGEED